MATNVIPPAAKEVIGSGAPGLVAKLARAERLASLDAFRGFIMFWIVGGGGLMVGVSVALSAARRSHTESPRQMLSHALKRTAVLFLLGSLRESASLGSPYLIELSSALQPIAIASLVAFLLVRKSPRFQATAA